MFDKNVSELTSAEAAAELEHIAAEMAKSDIAYYQDDDPYLTDSQYDELKRRNQQIESRFPAVGSSRQPLAPGRRCRQKRIRQSSPSLSYVVFGRCF